MECSELLCFEIISSVGTARSSYIEAIQAAKAGEHDKAEELMKEGRISFNKGHEKHRQLVQKEAEGEKTEISLLLIHSEDQLMSAETMEIFAKEIIEIYYNKNN
jgi:Phosphotransferase system cellobiose-specific component IIA